MPNALNLSLPQPMAAPPCALAYSRDLTAADLLALESGLAPTTKPKPWSSTIKRITMIHHHIARFVAEGRKDVDIAAIVGISPSRVHVLRDDPAFVQLVAHYHQVNDAIYYDVHQRLATTAQLAIEEMNGRLEEDPKAVSMRELREIASMALDRIGVPAESVLTNKDAQGRSDAIAEEVRKLFAKRTNGVILEADTQPQHQTEPLPITIIDGDVE